MSILEHINSGDVSQLDSSELLSLLKAIWNQQADKLVDDYCELSGEDLEQTIVELLPQSKINAPDIIIDTLLKHFELDPQFYELIHTAINIAFTTCGESKLSKLQIRLLQTLLSNHAIWSCDMHLPELLTEKGLPNTISELNKCIEV